MATTLQGAFQRILAIVEKERGLIERADESERDVMVESLVERADLEVKTYKSADFYGDLCALVSEELADLYTSGAALKTAST